MGLNSTLIPECNHYFQQMVTGETAVQKKLCKTISKINAPTMQIDPLQGQFLAFTTKTILAKQVLEIGTFVGYSSLWFAHALPQDGKLTTCDINQAWADIAKQAFIEDGVSNKISQIIQPALTTIDAWLTKPNPPQFDLIFIDADKATYPEYFEKCLSLLSDNGVMIFDNVWWHGELLNKDNQQKRTNVLRQFNIDLAKDARVDVSTVLLGDGMRLVRKRSQRHCPT